MIAHGLESSFICQIGSAASVHKGTSPIVQDSSMVSKRPQGPMAGGSLADDLLEAASNGPVPADQV